jgi:hypothetical protein
VIERNHRLLMIENSLRGNGLELLDHCRGVVVRQNVAGFYGDEVSGA